MKTSLKRIGQLLIDFILYVLVFISFIQVYNLVNTNFNHHYINNNQKIEEIMIDSHIYYSKDGKVILIEDNYDDGLTYFYEKYPYVDTTEKYDSYLEAKEKSNLFDKTQSGDFIVKLDVDKEELKTFYIQELKKAEVSLYNNSDYKELYKYVNTVLSVGSYIAVFLSGIIVYFLPFVFLKKRQSLGMLFVGLVLKSENGEKATMMQCFIRSFAFSSIVVLLSLKFFFLPLGISLIIATFDKKHRTAEEFLSVTYVDEMDQYI